MQQSVLYLLQAASESLQDFVDRVIRQAFYLGDFRITIDNDRTGAYIEFCAENGQDSMFRYITGLHWSDGKPLEQDEGGKEDGEESEQDESKEDGEKSEQDESKSSDISDLNECKTSKNPEQDEEDWIASTMILCSPEKKM